MIPTIVYLFASAPNCSLTPGNGISASCTGLPQASASSSTLHDVLAIFFGIAAVISVLMIVIGGIMYVTSGGSSQNTTRARETIIYAVVGLAVSLLAEAMVAFVLGKL